MLSQARMKAVASFPMESICSSPDLVIMLPTDQLFRHPSYELRSSGHRRNGVIGTFRKGARMRSRWRTLVC